MRKLLDGAALEEKIAEYRLKYTDLTEEEERALRAHYHNGSSLFFRNIFSVAKRPETETEKLVAGIERLRALLARFSDRANWYFDGHTTQWLGDDSPWDFAVDDQKAASND